MKFGVVIGVCTDRDEDQRKSLDSLAEFTHPDTEMIVIFNGVEPFAIHPRYMQWHKMAAIGREQGVWVMAYDFATRFGWDWCATFHDDFYLFEPGWEEWTEKASKTHRLGIVSYACWPYAEAQRAGRDPNHVEYTVNTGFPPSLSKPPGFLGVAVDGCGMAFNMNLFRHRGMFSPLKVRCGYGEMEAGFWVLSQGWGCAEIPLRSTHHPSGTVNTREALKVEADGVNETVTPHLNILPAEVLDENRIRLREKIVDVRQTQPWIPVLKPSYDCFEEAAVLGVLRRGWTGSGPEVEAFECSFADYLGVRPWQVIAVNNCTSALQLAVRAAGLKGHNVLVPPITFVSTAHAVEVEGGRVVFCDVEPGHLTLSARTLQGTARGVIPVHMAGVPVDMDAIWHFAEEHDLVVIEDCAHAVGSVYNGKPCGSDPRSMFSCFSFNAVKSIGAGDGGAIVCHDSAIAKQLRSLRWCGIDRETYDRSRSSYSWEYDVTGVSGKFQMSELNAAVARMQLAKLPAMNARRRAVAECYRRELGNLQWLVLPPAVNGVSNHLFIVRVDDRLRFIQHMASKHVHTGVHYKPLNLYGVYADRPNSTPQAHAAWTRLVSIPMHAALTDADVSRVIEAVKAYYP